MVADPVSRPAPVLSVCDGCDGEDQKPFEPLRFVARHRDWLCAVCRAALLEPEQSLAPPDVAPQERSDQGVAPAGIAAQYPARCDGNGLTWYRPRRDPGIGPDQWGWTSDPAQAHPDYRAVCA